MSPDFRELVGDDLSPEEEERLRRMHDALVTAGPPAELPPGLVDPPGSRRATVIAFPSLPRRRLATTLVAAAAAVAAVFGSGYWLGSANHAFESSRTVTMRGPSPAAFASIRLSKPDGASNWPLQIRVRGLRDLPKGGYYELLLTRDGKLGPSCGTFRTHDGKTTIVLNAPYALRKWNGWVVVAHTADEHTSPPVLTTRTV